MNKQFSRVGKIVPGSMSKLNKPVTRELTKVILNSGKGNILNPFSDRLG